ncbi:MAG: L,D-transpeptidase family protein [Gammaproteobacteria bacterium]|nr:L,D-transpeptidase family protein [Gammaproteobacteria bacterium]
MRRIALALTLFASAIGGACGANQPAPAPLDARLDATQQQDPLARITLGEASLAADVKRMYELHDGALLWQSPVRLKQLVAALNGLADDGLDPRNYAVDRLARDADAMTETPPVTVADRADMDVHATAACLLALYQLAHGVVNPRSVYPNLALTPPAGYSDAALRAVVEAVEQSRIAQAFDRARPQQPVYAALRNELAHLRAVASAGGWPTLAPGPSLKPGMRDPRVPELRRRLDLAGVPTAGDVVTDPDFYDMAIASAVSRYQARNLLDSDGVLGPATLAALNVTAATRSGQLRANLERARWFLPRLPGRYVLVDIAGYRLTYFDGAKPVWRARIQVGRPKRPTPVLRSTINAITLNPQWVVPPTILRQDILPRARRDPGYFARNRLHVLDATGRELDPRTIDWRHPPSGLTLRQDPGAKGALGVVAIRFPNPYHVYLHNTPHTRLFSCQQRAFSSGCVRVEHALKLAELLLDDPEHWNRAALDAAVATGETRNVPLAHPVPVLLLYWTVHTLDDGRVAFNPDVYQQDPPLLESIDRQQARFEKALANRYRAGGS